MGEITSSCAPRPSPGVSGTHPTPPLSDYKQPFGITAVITPLERRLVCHASFQDSHRFMRWCLQPQANSPFRLLGRTPSALYWWILKILYCNPRGRRALLRIPSTEGRSVCLCWAPSKPQGPKGTSCSAQISRPAA